MRPRIDYALGLAIALPLFMSTAACGPPAPDTIFLHTVQTGVTQSAEPPSRITEGDIFVVDADPKDDDESMDLCVDASVSGQDPGSVRVARVKGNCRRFVVVAQARGNAEVRFEVRGTASVLVLNIAPAR
jgi:hypothetical protein